MSEQSPEESYQFYPSMLNQGQQPAEDPLVPSAEPPTPEPPSEDELVHGKRKKTFGPDPSTIPESLPPGKAVLIISGVGGVRSRDHFSFELSSCCVEPDSYIDPNFGPPKLAAATNLAPGGPPAAQYLLQMRAWSEKKEDLRDWAFACWEAHPDDLELLIWDKSGAHLPWELLRVPASQSDEIGGFLGALATIIRWPGRKLPNAAWVNSLTDPVPSRGIGPVLGHVAGGMEEDWEMLGKFFELLPPAGSMFGLLHNLKNDARALAMVYVACHGGFGNAPEDFTLDGFSVVDGSYFGPVPLPGLTAQSTLAFLNACYSGSEGIDTDKYDDGALRGFADYFLSRGATGVLATTGAVGTDAARELARQLFTLLAGDSGLTVPQALRHLRVLGRVALEKAEGELLEKRTLRNARRLLVPQADLEAFDEAAKVEDTDETTALLPLLYPYLYAYFGLPRLWPTVAQPAVQPDSQATTGKLTGSGG